MEILKQILTTALTTKDNSTYDIIRILTLLSFIGYIGLAFYSLFLGNVVSLTDYATGIATILGSSGIALGVKANSEPPHRGLK